MLAGGISCYSDRNFSSYDGGLAPPPLPLESIHRKSSQSSYVSLELIDVIFEEYEAV